MIGRLIAVLALAGLGANASAAPPKRAVSGPPVARDWSRTVIATPDGGARIGNPAAPVKLVEYGSRTCPHCAHFAADGVPALKAGYIAKGQVSYEYRDYPVHNVLDFAPILLGRCAPVSRFFPLLDAMMANQNTLVYRSAEIPAADQDMLQKVTPNAVAAYLAKSYGYADFAVKHGIPAVRARACLADKKALDAIVARTNAANRDYRIQGTPTFIINGKVVDAAADWAALEPVLRAALPAR